MKGGHLLGDLLGLCDYRFSRETAPLVMKAKVRGAAGKLQAVRAGRAYADASDNS